MDLSIYDNSDFDRGAPRWKEAAWTLVRFLFFQNAFPWPSPLRCALLRAFGAKIGRGVVIRANVNVSFPWRLTIGDHVWIGEDVGILTLAPVTIKSNVCISQRAYLCTGSHNFRRKDFELQVAPITVREGSWIAAASFIAPGVEIGSGAVVSAGSVVFKNVPPNTWVRGNPATVVFEMRKNTTKGEKPAAPNESRVAEKFRDI
jgi:putative colanic acid biosynthesis acetyltransferase WcaF